MLWFWFYILSSIFCIHALKTKNSDIAILEDFYTSTGGPNWNYTSMQKVDNKYAIEYLNGIQWKFTKDSSNNSYKIDPCTPNKFQGIACNCDNILCEITQFALVEGKLKGSIPSSLGQLTALEVLLVQDNELSSNIPKELGQLTSLFLLNLGNNLLTSSIPSTFGNLIKLTNINLSNNKLTSFIPPELGKNLTELGEINFGNNLLTSSIPSTFGNLLNLKNLYLSYNRFSFSIPVELSYLKNLQHLHIRNNLLSSSIPPAFGKLTKLVTISLRNNKLNSSIPSTFGNLTELKILQLQYNQLTSIIPQELGRCKKLQNLHLTFNKLTSSIPSDLSLCTELTNLFLNENELSSTIPPSFENLVKLQLLNLANNKLSSSLPATLGKLTNLQLMRLQNNQITGTLPHEIGLLPNLQYLLMQNNNLKGSIPESVFPDLYELFLGNNSLTGQIPMFQSNSLRVLSLHDNQLSGHIVIKPTIAKVLEVFQVHNNKLSGNPFSTGTSISTSTSIINAKSLKVLDLSSNMFTGIISDNIFSKLTELKSFIIGSNCFSGSLPPNICQLNDLQTLVISSIGSGNSCINNIWVNTVFKNLFNGFISNSYIDGTLPECLFSMPKLNQLYAGGNRVVGKFPSTNISSNLTKISLPYNSMYGTLPSSFGENSNIILLDLSNNRISGDISMFKNSNKVNKNLDLSLSVNNLSGDIPIALRSLKNIDILAGNVFSCSQDRDTIPTNDPSVDSYECGSDTLDLYMYFFLIVFSLMLLIAYYIYSKHNFIFNEFNFWLEVVDERRRIYSDADNTIKIKSIYKYNYQLFNNMWIAFKIGLYLIAFFILYLCLGGSTTRLLEHNYVWITSSAYLTGLTSTVMFLIFGLLFICSILYMMSRDHKYYENNQKVAAAAINNTNTSTNTKLNDTFIIKFNIKTKILIVLRFFCMALIIWGPVVIGNIFYLSLLLSKNSTHIEETIFTVCFAIFKLTWSNLLPNILWENEWLFFGIQKKKHENASNDECGSISISKTIFIFTLNSVASFLIPIFVQMSHDPACFYNIFIQEEPSMISYSYKTCQVYDKEGSCYEKSGFLSNIFQTNSTIEATVPFVYNYTCINSILKVYAPVYTIIFTLALCHTFLNFLYICWVVKKTTHNNVYNVGDGDGDGDGDGVADNEILLLKKGSIVLAKSEVSREWIQGTVIECNNNVTNDGSSRYSVDFGFQKLTSIQKNMKKEDLRILTISSAIYNNKFWLAKLIVNFMPLKLLLDSSNDRLQKYDHKKGVFVTKSSNWMSNGTPNRLGSVLILITFGMYVPLLGFIIVINNVLQSFHSRLNVGRFLVRELTILEMSCRRRQESKVDIGFGETPYKYIGSIQGHGKHRLRFIQSEIRDVHEPWGSRAALQDIEKQCSILPCSIFVSSRYLYTIIASAMFSFTINDIYNGEADKQEGVIVVPMIAFIVPLVFMFVLFITDRYTCGSDSDSDSGSAANRETIKKQKSITDQGQGEEGDIEFPELITEMSNTARNPILKISSLP